MKYLRELPTEAWALWPHVQSGRVKSFYQKTSNAVEQTNAVIKQLRSKAPLQFVQGMVKRAAEFIVTTRGLVDTFEKRGRVVTPFADSAYTHQRVSSRTVTHFVLYVNSTLPLWPLL